MQMLLCDWVEVCACPIQQGKAGVDTFLGWEKSEGWLCDTDEHVKGDAYVIKCLTCIHMQVPGRYHKLGRVGQCVENIPVQGLAMNVQG